MLEFTSNLSEQQLLELINLAGKLFDEADGCARASQWRPAVLLLGGAVEAGVVASAAGLGAAFVATAWCLERERRGAGVWPRKRATTDWTLGQAARVATGAGWLPTV